MARFVLRSSTQREWSATRAGSARIVRCAAGSVPHSGKMHQYPRFAASGLLAVGSAMVHARPGRATVCLECTMQREESTDATGIATRIRNGQLRPDDVLDAAIARIEDTNETANAVIHTRFDEARAEVA